MWINIVQSNFTSLSFLKIFRKQELLKRKKKNISTEGRISMKKLYGKKQKYWEGHIGNNGPGRKNKQRSIRRSDDMTILGGHKWKVWIWGPTQEKSQDRKLREETLVGTDIAKPAKTCGIYSVDSLYFFTFHKIDILCLFWKLVLTFQFDTLFASVLLLVCFSWEIL